MQQVRHLLKTKGRTVFSIEPEASALAAIQMMAEKGIGALLVMRESKLLGIVSERDYARKVILHTRSATETKVEQIMTATVLTISPDDTVTACMQMVTEHRIRHLPVLENGKVVGVLSIGDLVKTVIDEQREHIEQLQHYIAG